HAYDQEIVALLRLVGDRLRPRLPAAGDDLDGTAGLLVRIRRERHRTLGGLPHFSLRFLIVSAGGTVPFSGPHLDDRRWLVARSGDHAGNPRGEHGVGTSIDDQQ